MSERANRRTLNGLRALLMLGVLSAMSCERVERSTPASSQQPEIITTPGGIEMVRIPAGRFLMGRDAGEEDQSPAHEVEIATFFMDRYETTQEHYVELMLDNGSHFKGNQRPAEMVSWVDAAMYCNERSRSEGLEPCYNDDATCNFEANGYRLPTEAEWEYACRAGNDGDYSFGSDSRKLKEHAWFKNNGGKKTHPVGQKEPNAWRLYDMLGNVAEWCNDMYDPAYYASSPAANPRGPKSGDKYVLRGGSWASSPQACRSAYRAADNPGFVDACFPRETIGFRCVRTAVAQVLP